MIEKAWGRPIADLEEAAARLPIEDPLLHAVIRTRNQLVVVDHAAVQAIHHLINAREFALKGVGGLNYERVRAATAQHALPATGPGDRPGCPAAVRR